MKRDYFRLSGGGAASKLIGAAREILLARYFGTGAVADAYRGSLTLTLSPVHLLASRAVQTCFVPLYARYAQNEPEKGRALFQSLLLVFVVLGILLGGALFLLARPLVGLILAGFDPERAQLAAAMLRILAVGVPFYVYCAVLGSLGAAQRDFVIPSLRPGLQNLGMVAFILLAALRDQAVLAALGFTATYLLLAGWATLHLRRRGLLPLRGGVEMRLVRETWARLWALLRPLLLLSVLVHANILIERHVAARIGPGSVAVIDYARFLTESVHFLVAEPLGLIGLSLFANLSQREFTARTDRVIALLLLVLVPISAFLLLNGRELLAILYLRGRFDQLSLQLTERVLWGLSAGLWAYSASFVLQRILSSRLQNRVVLQGQALAVLLNVACNLLLYRSLGVLALGIGVAVGACGSLLYYLRRVRPRAGELRRTGLHLIIVTPPYLLLAWALRSAFGRSWEGLLLQSLVALLYWAAAIAVRGESRRMVWDRFRRGGRR